MKLPWRPLILFALAACARDDRPGKAHPEPAGTTSVGALRFDGAAPKNLLMISIDTLRRDHIGRYDSRPSLTPFLDGLLEQGVALDDFQQCSNWTFPSTSCTLAGRDHVDGGFLPRLDRDTRQPFPEGTPFLAGHLADAGFDTWISSVNGWLSSTWGNTQGYAHELDAGIFYLVEIEARAVEPLVESIDAGTTDRWFLHLHAIEPHAPYRAPYSYMTALDGLPPVPWNLDDFDVHYEVTRDLWPDLTPEEQALLEQHLRIRYDSQMTWLDDELRAVFDDLDRQGLLDDTLVVFWSDHGEQFWEHGHQTHAYGLYGEERDAFALFWAKNLRPQPWTEPTLSIDLAPTLLAAMGVPVPDAMTGQIVGTAPPDRPRYAQTLARLGALDAIERNGLELIFDWTGTLQAFDRSTDPGETVDVLDLSDPDQAELWSLLQARVQAEALLAPEFPVVWPAGI